MGEAMRTGRSPNVKRAIGTSLVVLSLCAMVMIQFPCGCRAEGDSAGRRRWATARVQGILTVPLGDNSVEGWNDCGSDWFDYLDFYSAIGVNTSAGILASFEYVFARRYGIEIGFVYWNRIVDLQFEAGDLKIEGSPNFIMPTLGVNYHFLTDERKDIYGGALCALGVVATGFFTDIEVSKDLALGLTMGADYYIKGSWCLGGCLKYVDFGEIDFSVLPPGMAGIICDNGLFGLGHMNVMTATCGIGFRF